MKKQQKQRQGVFGLRSLIAGGVALGFSLLSVQAEEAPDSLSREWKSGNGKFSVQATFDSFDAFTKQVTLRKEDSTSIKVPFAKLSAADQSYVKERAPKAAQTKEAGEQVKLYGIKWQPKIEDALTLAASQSDQQPVMWFRVLGQLDDGM